MHKSLENFSKECFWFFKYLNVQSLKLKLQLSLQVFASHPSIGVVVEYLALETILLKNFNIVGGLILHASNSVKHIFITIGDGWDKFSRHGDDTWEVHNQLMLRFFFNHLLVDCFSLSLLVLDVCKLLSACTFSSLSPILVVSSVVLHQEFMISLFELLILLLVDDN